MHFSWGYKVKLTITLCYVYHYTSFDIIITGTVRMRNLWKALIKTLASIYTIEKHSENRMCHRIFSILYSPWNSNIYINTCKCRVERSVVLLFVHCVRFARRIIISMHLSCMLTHERAFIRALFKMHCILYIHKYIV